LYDFTSCSMKCSKEVLILKALSWITVFQLSVSGKYSWMPGEYGVRVMGDR
jgi:hypothetical protein